MRGREKEGKNERKRKLFVYVKRFVTKLLPGFG